MTVQDEERRAMEPAQHEEDEATTRPHHRDDVLEPSGFNPRVRIVGMPTAALPPHLRRGGDGPPETQPHGAASAPWPSVPELPIDAPPSVERVEEASAVSVRAIMDVGPLPVPVSAAPPAPDTLVELADEGAADGDDSDSGVRTRPRESSVVTSAPELPYALDWDQRESRTDVLVTVPEEPLRWEEDEVTVPRRDEELRAEARALASVNAARRPALPRVPFSTAVSRLDTLIDQVPPSELELERAVTLERAAEPLSLPPSTQPSTPPPAAPAALHTAAPVTCSIEIDLRELEGPAARGELPSLLDAEEDEHTPAPRALRTPSQPPEPGADRTPSPSGHATPAPSALFAPAEVPSAADPAPVPAPRDPAATGAERATLASPSAPPPAASPVGGSFPPVVAVAPTSTPVRPRRSRLVSWGAFLGVMALCVGVMAFVLQTRRGSVLVHLATPDDGAVPKAEIFLDGQKRCDTDPCILRDVAPGAHVVKVVAPGRDVPSVVQIEVLPSRETAITVMLSEAAAPAVASEPAPAPAPEATRPGLSITLGTEGARVVLVTGRVTQVVEGPFPKTLELEPGEYKLVASRYGYAPFSQRIVLREGDAAVPVEVLLTPEARDDTSGARDLAAPVTPSPVAAEDDDIYAD